MFHLNIIMVNLTGNGVSSAESRHTCFSQIPASTIPPSTIHDLCKTLIYLLLLLATVEVQMENEKIVMSAIFSAVSILYQGY